MKITQLKPYQEKLKLLINIGMTYTHKNTPRWEKYKSFFQYEVLRYLVVWFTMTPVIAKIFENVPDEIVLNIWEYSLAINLGLTFNWKLLWLSSLIYIISLILYQIFCPGFIKEYNQYDDYAKKGHDPRWLVWIAAKLVKNKKLVRKFTERMLEKRFITEVCESNCHEEPQVLVKETVLHYECEGRKYSFSMPQYNEANHDEIKSVENSVFWEIFGRYSGANFKVRITIMLFLIISGIFFIIPLFGHIVAGLKFVFSP